LGLKSDLLELPACQPANPKHQVSAHQTRKSGVAAAVAAASMNEQSADFLRSGPANILCSLFTRFLVEHQLFSSAVVWSPLLSRTLPPAETKQPKKTTLGEPKNRFASDFTPAAALRNKYNDQRQ